MSYTWKYANLGGNTRVVLSSGQDIAHLPELDQKFWTILSCPTKGLEIPDEVLRLLDTDGDGRIRVAEVKAAAARLCRVLRDPDCLMAGTDALSVTDLNSDDSEGAAFIALLQELTPDGQSIGVSEVRARIADLVAAVPAAVAEAAPACPVEGDVLAAYREKREANNAYFQSVRLSQMGLAAVNEEACPGVKEADWKKLSETIDAWDKEVAAIEAKNTEAAAAEAAAKEAIAARFAALIDLMLLKRYFFCLLRNYVSLQAFYTKGEKAIFQCGTLVIDQRTCDLCLQVNDAGAMAAQAGQSGMFLLFCDCENKPTGKKMSIVAAMTMGDIHNLMVGKNAIFYDRNGLDYEARVTKIIDQPISLKQAFWSPYRKFADWVTGLINKSVAEKESKGLEDMKAKATTATAEAQAAAEAKKDGTAPAAAPAPAFDIAKFAGIFAAFGMAIGAIGTALTSIAGGFATLHWWQTILVILGILLTISGPSMLLTYFRLRRRNVAPLLNANGWAVNAESLVNAGFGASLTEEAQYPLVKLNDPFDLPVKPKKCSRKTCLIACAAVLLLAALGAGAYGIYRLANRPAAEQDIPAPEMIQDESWEEVK